MECDSEAEFCQGVVHTFVTIDPNEESHVVQQHRYFKNSGRIIFHQKHAHCLHTFLQRCDMPPS